MASTSKESSKIQTNRLPAPALFVGPPSHNTSNTSLLPSGSDSRDTTRVPIARQRSLLSPDSKRPLPPTTGNQYDDDNLSLTTSNPSVPFQRRQWAQIQAAEAEATSRADAVWAEMQNTLEEVELSAIKGPGMTVFGSDHSRALDELRRAQIELAKAWARSEADENEASGGHPKNKMQDIKTTNLVTPTLSKNRDKTGVPKGEKMFDRTKLEEETEKDIEMSRRRREENDRYFEKVNKGVQEVIVRLEEVAKSMRVVESESKEIWGHESDGGDTESLTTGLSNT